MHRCASICFPCKWDVRVLIAGKNSVGNNNYEHLAHLNSEIETKYKVDQICHILGLDVLIFVIVNINPHQKSKPESSFHSINMWNSYWKI